jgi:bacteriocin-like protein
MTRQNNEVTELTTEELDAVTGGGKTNGDNPFVQVVTLAEKAAFYKASFYADQGWKS